MRKPARRILTKDGALAASSASQLPNAPLVEVVFELRWQLHGGKDSLPVPFRTDPGLLPLLHDFALKADKLGFSHRLDMARPHEVYGNAVTTRFRQSSEAAFPLLQVGSGIFAVNDGPLYEWRQYKANVLSGLSALLKSYPRLPGFEFAPNYLEIRYINSFDEAILNTPDLPSFLGSGTVLEIAVPPFIDNSDLFESSIQGRIALQRKLKGWPSSTFVTEIASATNAQTSRSVFQLLSKVVTEEPGVPALGPSFRRRVAEWLDFAHSLTSPFFKSFIKGTLMSQFEAAPK